MKLLIILVTIPLLWQCSHSQQAKKFFRKDYTYLEDTRSFYKIHTLHKTWIEAKKRCALEGASLFYPEHQAEADKVIEFWNKTQPFYWLHIGVSSLLAKGVFETIDGTPIEDVFHNWSPGEPNNAGGVEDCVILRRDGTLNDDRCDRKNPFICKKSIDSLQWNIDCNSPNIDYKYNADIGRCYKFHLKPQNWTDAYTICNAEQSYLAVIDNQKEADYLVKLTAEAPKDKVRGDFLPGAVHLGFHNRQGEGWTTVKGQTLLEDSGYNRWSGSQPDGGDDEQCGSMFYNGDLNDVNCSTRCFFICEHDVDILGLIFDDRIGRM